MRIHIKESVVVSMAALGFFAAVGISQSATASAKSRVRVTSNVKLRTDASSRNVAFTGKAALWTKASSLKSAKKLFEISKSGVGKLRQTLKLPSLYWCAAVVHSFSRADDIFPTS